MTGALGRHNGDAVLGVLARGGDDVGVGHDQVRRNHEARAGAIKHPPFAGLQDDDDAHDAAFGLVDGGLRRRRGHERERERGRQEP